MKYSLLCVALALTAACSSSGSSKASAPTTTTAPAPPITKASYIARANAICTTMNRKTNAVADPGNDPDKAADALARVNSYIGSGLAQLRALPVPAGEGAQLDAIYAKVDALRQGLDTYIAALRAHHKTAASAASTRVDALGNAANTASNQYGLTVCGS